MIKAEICAEEYSPLDFASSNYFDYKFSCEGTTSFFTFKDTGDSAKSLESALIHITLFFLLTPLHKKNLGLIDFFLNLK